MAATRYKDGESEAFIAADFLPNFPGGTVPIGQGGQIYSIAGLDDGRTAISLGWNRGGTGHNAVVFVTFNGNRQHVTDRLIELPGVRGIVGASHGRVLAVTTNAMLPGGGPTLTLLANTGDILGQWLDGNYPTAVAAARAANGIRLQEILPGRYAIFDATDLTLRIIELPATERASMTTRSTIVINDDISGLSIRDVYTSRNGVTALATVGRIDGQYRTSVNEYGPDGNVLGRWRSENPWQTIVHRGHVFTGSVIKDDVSTETVDLPGID